MILEDWLKPFLEIPIDAYFALMTAAVLLAGFLRGFIGFGAALIIVPVLSLVLGPQIAIAVLTVMGFPSTIQLLPDAWRHGERAIILPMSLAIFTATPLGTWFLVSIDPNLMKIVISAAVVLMVAFLAKGWHLDKKVGRPILLLAGTVGGLVQGAAGIGGPPVVAVALSRAGAPEQQRGNVLAVIAATVFSTIPPLFYFNLFTPKSVAYGLVLLLPYSIATWAGSRYFNRGGQRHFRNAALIVLAIIGLATLAASVWNALNQSS
ncbi:MAG: sulfite exporter TauE/SafE family protein [Alphaproteobacteria bacterium]|nr:sulfite exporter TauE/SafE family protein [Alphaproteobacteria bacterium]